MLSRGHITEGKQWSTEVRSVHRTIHFPLQTIQTSSAFL